MKTAYVVAAVHGLRWQVDDSDSYHRLAAFLDC